jgi:endonuclease/exonuclease/phosphatase family metal-dependent hydrolase
MKNGHIMKKKILLITALMALVPVFSFAKEPSQLTVISYNIRQGIAEDGTNSWEYRFPCSAMMIEDQKPDIFGLQEAYDFQVRYLKEYTKGYKCVGVGRENGKAKGEESGEHMEIFYNKQNIKLLKWGTYWLSETPDEPSLGWDGACKRTATWALMKDKRSGQKFYYVNTHLDHVGREAQKNGLALIVSRIGEMNPNGLPTVLTGDFNVTPDDEILSDLNTKMKSAREYAVKTDKGQTFNGWGYEKENKAIDYIYYKGFSSCPVFEVIRKPYMDHTYISDHYPVKATLVF